MKADHSVARKRQADASSLGLEKAQRAETLGDQACRSLRAALRRGALLPGQRLTTRGIAATLGISPTPAREALSRLVAERVLELDIDRTVRVPVLTRAGYGELCVIRLELEGLAARLACRRIMPAQLAHLQSLYAAHRDAWERRDTTRSLQLNEDFHFTIYAASAMPALLQILETLWLQVGPSMNLLFPASYDLGWKGGENHRDMLEAIRRGDARALVQAVRRDLTDGRARLNDVLPAAG